MFILGWNSFCLHWLSCIKVIEILFNITFDFEGSSSSGSLPGQKFPNKNVLPSVTFDPKDPLTPVIALYNYAARTDEELTFGEGRYCYSKKYLLKLK